MSGTSSDHSIENLHRLVNRMADVGDLESLPSLPDVPEVWNDVEDRLRGFLEGRVFGAKRTPATPQSLNLQGLNWCEKNKEHLGPLSHEWARARLVARCVTTVLSPTSAEDGLIAMYQHEGDKIRALNEGLEEMGDRRKDLRWLIGAAGVTTAAVGVAAHFTGQKGVGVILGAVGIAGVGLYGWSKARDVCRAARAARWY